MREIFDRAYEWLFTSLCFIRDFAELVVSPVLSAIAYLFFPIWIIPYLIIKRKSEVSNND